ncbi:MAG: phosphoribosylanthranilate isomerase [Longimicrobiaceae bacterium]
MKIKTPAIKFCGFNRPGDARAAGELGATYGGVILSKGSPRWVDIEYVPRVFMGSSLKRVGVFVDCSLPKIRYRCERGQLAVVQLHGEESPEEVRELKETGGWEVWKAIRIRSVNDFRSGIESYAPVADGILVEGWSPSGQGGVGARFPWGKIKKYRDEVPPGVKFIVAGGLKSRNVGQCVRVLRPDVVDVSSGVETGIEGFKDDNRMGRFVNAVRREVERMEQRMEERMERA